MCSFEVLAQKPFCFSYQKVLFSNNFAPHQQFKIIGVGAFGGLFCWTISFWPPKDEAVGVGMTTKVGPKFSPIPTLLEC